MIVGVFSPLPPARSGVADYSASLLRALAPLGSVKVNARDADIALYHLGNNRLHREIYHEAMARPGVIVLHDAVLHHFFLGYGNEEQYVAEFVYNYGEWSEQLARDLWRRRARSAADPEYFRYPMLRRVVECSLAVIVHNPRAAALVREHVPSADVYEIPHLFEIPRELPPESEVIRWRAAHGIASHALLAGVFGHLRESKRLHAVLRAFHRARRSADMKLLIAGEFGSSDLARSLEPLIRGHSGIIGTGYLNERDFWLCASAVDACVNLRYPMAGETSGISMRLMGIGKPVIVSAGEETSRFPEAASLRVDSGETEEEMLAQYLVWLARHPDEARAIGHRAAEFIRAQHAPEQVARLYWDVLSGCYHKISAVKAV